MTSEENMSYTTTTTLAPGGAQDGAAASQPPAYDLGPDEEEFAELPPQRHIRRITQAVAVVVALCVAYTGGVLAQKNHDASSSSASALPAFGAGGAPAGFGGGGAPGASSAGSSTSSGPAVIGTITSVSADSVTVTDLAGNKHVVHLSTNTTITQSTALDASALKSGSTVTVEGSKASDGSITATTVTSR